MSETVKRFLWPKGPSNNVWAIVDGARDKRVYWSLVNSYLPSSCLFAGPLPEAVERAAPYLIQLDQDDAFTQQLLHGWGNSLCVYLRCDRPLAELRRHLRGFLTVVDAGGDRLLFRYYDPRVMRAYLPTCQLEELKTVFGPIEAYWMESRSAGELLEFRWNGRGLQTAEHVLGET
ncbi:MAG: DUF4123 domain-containing protein [Bryobacteraceae bacterium]